MYEPFYIHIYTHIYTRDSFARVSSTLIKKISMPIVVKLHEGTKERNVVTRSTRGEGKFFSKKNVSVLTIFDHDSQE